MRQPKAGQKLKQTIDKHKAEPSSRPFFPCNVGADVSSYLRVEKDFLVLSKSELAKALGRDPRGKDPKAHVVTLQLDQPEPEVCYVFRDPERPHRRLIAGHYMGETKQELVLPAENHHFDTQAFQTLRGCFSNRTGSSGEGDLDSRQLNTLDEYLSKVASRDAAPAQPSKKPVQKDGSAKMVERRSVKKEPEDSDDDVAEVGSAEAADDSRGHLSPFDLQSLPEAEALRKTLKKLNIRKILSGKKLGREIRNAGIRGAPWRHTTPASWRLICSVVIGPRLLHQTT